MHRPSLCPLTQLIYATEQEIWTTSRSSGRSKCCWGWWCAGKPGGSWLPTS